MPVPEPEGGRLGAALLLGADRVPLRCEPEASEARISSSLRRRWIELEMVFQLVSMPPSQRWLT